MFNTVFAINGTLFFPCAQENTIDGKYWTWEIYNNQNNMSSVFTLMYYLKNSQECFIRFKATSAQREWL
jgi:hypothetical protein